VAQCWCYPWEVRPQTDMGYRGLVDFWSSLWRPQSHRDPSRLAGTELPNLYERSFRLSCVSNLPSPGRSVIRPPRHSGSTTTAPSQGIAGLV
jgi:hypothetical protein